MGTIYRTASFTATSLTYARITVTFRWAEIETDDSYTIEMVDVTASDVSYTGGTQAQRQADYNSICGWLQNVVFGVYVRQSGENDKYAGGVLDSTFSPGTTRPVNIPRSAIVLKNKTEQSINVCGCSTGSERNIRTTTSVTVPKITSYNITIHANGGGSDIIYTKWYNEPLILKPQDLNLQYYKLIGFSESLNQAHIGDIEYTSNDTYINNESIELYATWELEYSKPTINNVKINRCLSDGTLDDTGENISIHFTWSVFRSNRALYYGGDNFPYTNNGSSILLEVGEFSKTLLSSSDVGIVDEILGNDSISADLEYTCIITLSDTESIQSDNTIIYSDSISTAYFPIDFNGRGTAMGIFMPAPDNEEGIFLGKNLNLPDGQNVSRTILDYVRPIGSAYSTVDPNFNPNTVWGGTWKKLPEGYVLLSGSDSGSYIVGDDNTTSSGYNEYGENTHTLVADELPSHTHGNKSLTGYFTMRRGGTNNTQNIWAGGIASVQTNSEGNSYNLNYASSQNKSDRIKINASHEHTSVGLNQAHNIMQKSIAVYWWIRTA